MKKIFIFCWLVVFANLGISQDIAKNEILEVASTFLKKSVKTGSGEVELIPIDENDTILLYLAHDNNNFILFANDLRVKPILGYSNENSYQSSNLPPQLVELLERYKNQIQDIKRGLVKNTSSFEKDWEEYLSYGLKNTKAEVSPFINVNWNQGSGWNRYCPEDAEGPGGRAYVGCVAVSMGQAMSVYEHPNRGVGESSYNSDLYGGLSANYGETDYNWELMSSSTSDDYNSLLLYHCAVSVRMGFGPDGSGAYTRDAANAMKSYFDYSGDLYYKESTEDQEWQDLLKAELDAGRPIIYAGNDGANTGHAFNLDGYDNSGAFHVNWGWSGSYNGYFQITNLTPGGSNYSENAKAIFNIIPKDHSSTDIELTNQSFKDTCKVGDIIGILSTVDPDPEEEFVYGVKGQSGPGGNTTYCPFYTEGDSLKLGEVVSGDDHEFLYITITSEELSGEILEKDFTIEVLKDNYAPTAINISNDTFDDTLSIGSFIATFTTIDPDEVDTFTYELVDHTNLDLCKDNGKFVISNDSLLTNYDFSNTDENTCIINIKTTDHKGESITESFNLNINLLTSNTLLIDKKVGIELYPNPVKDRLIINSMEKSIQHVKIYNLIGSTIGIYENRNNLEEMEIFIDGYKSGYYLVQVGLEDGRYITSKILKE